MLVLAEESYRKGLKEDPGYKNLHLNLGLIHFQRGENAAAEREYLQEIKLHDNNLQAHLNLGAMYHTLEEYYKAIVVYEKARKINPLSDDLTHNLRIACLKYSNQLEEQGEDLEAANWRWKAEQLAGIKK